MKYKLKDVCKILTKTINPSKNPEQIYDLYSLPSYDDSKKVEKIKGKYIKSNKILIKGKLILFNKLNLKFKRIWNVNIDNDKSICSTEFIPIKANLELLNNDYLYYILLTDKLNNYLIESSTGTSNSHQRINKDLLLEQEIFLPTINEQIKIVKILKTIDRKIELNIQINNNLLDLGDKLYKKYFEKGSKNCKLCRLKDVVNNYDCKRKPMSSREREKHQGKYPYYGATSIIDYVDDYIFDGTYLLMGEDGTVVTDKGKPVLQYIWGKNWVNNHAHVLEGKIISTEHLMFFLRNCSIRDIITGAVQPKINQENMNSIEIILTDEENNEKFESIINSIMEQYKKNIEQTKKLEQLRDALLPKLINGKIDIDKIEI